MRKILISILILGLIGSIVAWFIMAFSHPELTQMQVFLKYWYLNAIAVVCGGVAIALLIKA